ncbi:MAG: putative lipid II flippase FtsW [Thiotrichaceae bacterium]|uniref:Probable peptidoglycan glycosyltransferase FtsW n=1 Tax=Candidatus Thiocaldithrix dubininis TaxID=3080823 RepID=A0AA95H5N2_9GAMM|nr:MAG: putative lipid II flippase FtsW [Candidatus Thiocaldithrix dubininis]
MNLRDTGTTLQQFSSTPWSRYLDRDLMLVLFALLGIGIVMLGSASLWVADKQYQNAYYYLQRQLGFLGIGLCLALLIYQVRLDFWRGLGVWLLPAVLVLLVLVLIPGIGKNIKGSYRWIDLGFMNLQVSEVAKLIMLLYLSGYMIRHGKKLATSPSYEPLVIPLVVLGVIGGLLLIEPDFGSTVIILVSGLALLFLGGVPLKRLGLLLGGALIIMIPASFWGYRGARWQALFNPWEYETDQGYQTVHALLAIGDGGWFGQGLGGSVQKLFYLPEAHNDFIFAVLAEEFGFLGILAVLALYALLVYRSFYIGFQADKHSQHYGAYIAYGMGFWLGLQVILNIGVNLAVFPPKGLTLPLMSYGGSSLIVALMGIALVMRVHRETQIAQFGLPEKKAKNTSRTGKTVRRIVRGL